MIIDILFALTLALAVFKGFSRGLIAGLFSLLALVLGLAAALKLSVWAAGWFSAQTTIDARWIPFIAFLVVFIAVVLLVRLGAKAIEKTAEIIQLGWLNKIGGVVFYAFTYILVFSVLLFYAEKMHVFTTDTISKSLVADQISPLGPQVINALASLIPWFRDMFAALTGFFDKLSADLPAAPH